MADRDSLLPALRDTEPDDVGEAIRRIAQIGAISGWLKDAEEPIREWLLSKAAEVEALTGGAFNVPVAGVGRALLTKPQPQPRISDREAFARWYVETLLEDDPDRDHSETIIRFDDYVGRRRTATCDPMALLKFADEFHAEDTIDYRDQVFDAAVKLAGEIDETVEWLAGDAILQALLDGEIHPTEDGARLKAGDVAVFDTTTAEAVPGTTVVPAASRSLSVTPDKKLKTSLRQELDAIIGPPALPAE